MLQRFTIRAWCILGFAACQAGGSSDDAGNQDAGGRPQCDRWVLEGEVTNARDLGGHPLWGGGYVSCGQILRGGDLTRLTDTGCSDFSNLGIRTVIDLRMASTQQNQPPAACVSDRVAVVPAPMPKLLPDTPQNYLALLNETEAVSGVFAELGRPEAYPVYVHCVIGRDRASFVAALVLLALGAEHQTVLDEFELSEEAGVAVQPECLQAVLDEIDRRGGIQQTLSAAGVTSAQLEVLGQQGVTD